MVTRTDIDKLAEVGDCIHAHHNNRLMHSLHEPGQPYEEILNLKPAIEGLIVLMKWLSRQSHSYSFPQQTTRKRISNRK